MKTENGLLKELKGTLALEGIEVSDERLGLSAAEYEEARSRGAVDALIGQAKARFSSVGRSEAASVTALRHQIDFLTHLMGNALVPLSTHQQLLTDKWNDPEFRASLNSALGEGVKQMSRLIKQMRLLAGEFPPSPEPFPLQSVIDEAFQEAGKHRPGKRAQLRYETGSRSVVLTGDREALKHALADVMLCAFSSNPPEPTTVRLNGTSLEIDIPTREMEVSDTVCAFAFGGDRGTNSDPSLALSKAVIEMHKGTIGIGSPKSGHAGMVRISIPVKPVEGTKV